MKSNRAAPFLGPFSGPKKWTAGDVPHAMCRANAASFREIGPASGYMFQHSSRTKVRSARRSFLLFKEGLEPRSKLEQQRKQVFKADLEPLRYTRLLNHMEGPPAWSLQTWL